MENSVRQANYREKMKEKGYIQTTVFIPKTYRESLKNFVKKLAKKYEKEK